MRLLQARYSVHWGLPRAPIQERTGRNFRMQTRDYHVGAPARELRELLSGVPKNDRQIFPGPLSRTKEYW